MSHSKSDVLLHALRFQQDHPLAERHAKLARAVLDEWDAPSEPQPEWSSFSSSSSDDGDDTGAEEAVGGAKEAVAGAEEA